MYIVYELINVITNDIYIGCTTKTLEERFSKHIKASKVRNPSQSLYLAFKEYGAHNFKMKKLYTGLRGYDKERELIEKLKPKYNDTIGGTGGDFYSNKTEEEKLEIRKKQRLANLNNEYSTMHGLSRRKLSNEDIIFIKNSSIGDVGLSKMFSCAKGTIWKIRRGLRYKDIN